MQLCKDLNCFLKSHNKQLNQYCCNFIVLYPKKKVFKYGSGYGLYCGLGRVGLQKKESGHGSTYICFGSKNGARVKSSQEILIRFAMSNLDLLFFLYYL